MIEIVPALAVLNAATLTTAKTGTDQVFVEFTFTDGPNKGKRITDYLALTDAALPWTMKKLRNCGLPEDAGLEELSSIIGGEAEIVPKEEADRNGEMRVRIAFINKPGGGRPAVDPAAQVNIAQKYKAKIAALPKEASPFD